MLKTIDILNRMDLIEREQYKDMLSQINIPDFYKCIAQFSGLNISELKDEVIYEYLYTWCVNKYRFYKAFGNKVKLDTRITYVRPKDEIKTRLEDLQKTFPVYAPWIRMFHGCRKNKINSEECYISWETKSLLKDLFGSANVINGTTLTHFFKSKLNADDKFVTELGRIFENDKIESNFTLSIDPTDMMLASDNPYNWTSCYRLELARDDSHADGCMAAVLDTVSIITYVWDNHGKFTLYDIHKFKDIRYKRMRMWCAIHKDWGAIHFNDMYPGRSDYSDELLKTFREVVERVVAEAAGVENIWKKNKIADVKIKSKFNPDDYYEGALWDCERIYNYGYGEYSYSSIWYNSQMYPADIMYENEMMIHPFDVQISCPCGCGEKLIGSNEIDADEGYYNGEGFLYENYTVSKWCEYCEDWCSYGLTSGEECDHECYTWQQENPVCELDDGIFCENPDWEYGNVSDGVSYASERHCCNCPHWERCHQEEEEGDEK